MEFSSPNFYSTHLQKFQEDYLPSFLAWVRDSRGSIHIQIRLYQHL